MSNLRDYAFHTRHAGRIVADREAAIAECQAAVPHTRLMAQDSAENVFRATLSSLGVDHLALPAEALPAMFRVTRRSGTVNSSGAVTMPRLALDAEAAKSFNERYPNAARIKFV